MIQVNRQMNLKSPMLSKKALHERGVLYNSLYIKCQEMQTNVQQWKADQWFPEVAGAEIGRGGG